MYVPNVPYWGITFNVWGVGRHGGTRSDTVEHSVWSGSTMLVHVYRNFYWEYYIPERVIVRMFTLRKWLSPRSIIIFEGWTFLLLPSQDCTIYFIIPKLLSGKSPYVNGADEEVSPKLLEFGFKMCGSILSRKRVPTLDGFIHKQRRYRHFNATKYVFRCRHCNSGSDRFKPYAH